jgi:hypothetical protein
MSDPHIPKVQSSRITSELIVKHESNLTVENALWLWTGSFDSH